jgi:hypothetical protein
MRIDENERLRAGTIGHCGDLRFDTGPREFLAMNRRRVIISKFADISRSHSPSLTSNHCSSDLATW